MINTYAYQILSDRAGSKYYYEATHRDKTLQFIRIGHNQWDMYYKGLHIAAITPGFVTLSYETVDEILLRSAFEVLRRVVLDIMTSDEAYQVIDTETLACA